MGHNWYDVKLHHFWWLCFSKAVSDLEFDLFICFVGWISCWVTKSPEEQFTVFHHPTWGAPIAAAAQSAAPAEEGRWDQHLWLWESKAKSENPTNYVATNHTLHTELIRRNEPALISDKAIEEERCFSCSSHR